MTSFEALILGTVQGLTEFLPVSSSGHLVLISNVLGVQKAGIEFEIIIHLATLVAVVLFFAKSLLKLTRREYMLLAIGTIPAVVFGVIFKKFIELSFNNPAQTSIELIVTGILLLFAQRKLKHTVTGKVKEITFRQAFIIGCWQAIAILPGISRSGATVTGALLLNIEREAAFRFSFLLSIPAILGASVFILLDAAQSPTPLEFSAVSASLGFATAIFFGILSLRWFKQVIQKAQLWWFAVYCFVLAAISLTAQFAFIIL